MDFLHSLTETQIIGTKHILHEMGPLIWTNMGVCAVQTRNKQMALVSGLMEVRHSWRQRFFLKRRTKIPPAHVELLEGPVVPQPRASNIIIWSASSVGVLSTNCSESKTKWSRLRGRAK